ncbi:MAG: arylsulfatase [Chitinophagaceae bacterium]|nr:arylsulfatase [Chitinophagaceae bacterium]
MFIIADDLGYGDIEPYGQKLIKTPHLAKFAKEGMRFTQFYSGTTVCAPSRASLMTGMHTGHAIIRGNKEVKPEGQQPIAANTYTIAEAMKAAGYTTGLFGKWGLGPMESTGDPLKHGIDRFYGYNCQRAAHRYYPDHLWDNEKKVILEENEHLKKTVTYAPDLIQQQALQFMDENQQQPFVMFLTYILPHAELLVPDDSIYQYYKGKFPETTHKGNDYGSDAIEAGYTSQPFPHATFAAMVSRLDVYVGQVMQKLQELNLDDNTIVFFTSDNGPHVEGGADPAFFNSAGGFRGVKTDIYEGGIRVPFMVRWVGKIKAGVDNNYIGAFWDIFPTFTQIAKTETPSALDGISILPTLRSSKQAKHEYLYWEFHAGGGKQAVRSGNWKAIRLNVFDKSKTIVELYNLNKDPNEKDNIASLYPEIVKRLTNLMDEAHTPSDLFPFGGE